MFSMIYGTEGDYKLSKEPCIEEAEITRWLKLELSIKLDTNQEVYSICCVCRAVLPNKVRKARDQMMHHPSRVCWTGYTHPQVCRSIPLCIPDDLQCHGSALSC